MSSRASLVVALLLSLCACEPSAPGGSVPADPAHDATRPEAPTPAAEMAAPVVAAERAFAARHQQVSARTAWDEFSAEYGIDIGPAGVRSVKAAILDWPQDSPAGTIQWGPAVAGVARSGELGFTSGPAILDDGAAYSTYATLWQKQPDGSWKWLIDLGSEPGPQDLGTPPAQPTVWSFAAAQDGGTMATLAHADAAIDQDTLTAHLAPGARLMGAPLRAADDAETWMAQMQARPALYASDHRGGGVSAAGDFGWTYGFLVPPIDPANDVTAAGKAASRVHLGGYLRIWQHRAGGWRILLDSSPRFPNPKPSSAP